MQLSCNKSKTPLTVHLSTVWPTITAAPDRGSTRARGGTVVSRTETSYKSPPNDRSATKSVAEGYLPTSKRLPTVRCTVQHGYDSSAGGKTCQGQPRCCVDNKLCFSSFYLKVGTTLHVIFFLLPMGRKPSSCARGRPLGRPTVTGLVRRQVSPTEVAKNCQFEMTSKSTFRTLFTLLDRRVFYDHFLTCLLSTGKLKIGISTSKILPRHRIRCSSLAVI